MLLTQGKKKSKIAKKKKLNKLKHLLMHMVNEMLSYTGLQCKLLQNQVKEKNSTKRKLKYTRTRWKLIQTQLKDVSSDSELNSDPDAPSNSSKEGRIPSNT